MSSGNLGRRLLHWWFAPSERFQPGLFRVLLIAWFGWYYFTRLFERLAGYALRSLDYWEPPSLVRVLHLPLPMSPTWVGPVEVVATLLVVTAGIGLLTRVSLIALAALNLYLGLWANSWGFSSHSTAMPALALLLLAFAPGATSCSVDSLICARFKLHSKLLCHRVQPGDWKRCPSVWPVRGLLIMFCLVYFSAGLSKLRYSGWQWADGETLGFYFQGGSTRGDMHIQRFVSAPNLSESEKFRDGFGLTGYLYVGRPTKLAGWLSAQPGLLSGIALLSMLLELAFPLALLGRRWRNVMLLGGVGFHTAIFATLNINFMSYVLCYGLFVNWAGLLDAGRARLRQAGFNPRRG